MVLRGVLEGEAKLLTRAIGVADFEKGVGEVFTRGDGSRIFS